MPWNSRFLPLLAVLLLTGSTFQAQAQEDRIAFLQVKFTENTITLLASNTVPGRLKPLRLVTAKPGVDIEVQTSTGEVVWLEQMENPLLERVEWSDESGVMQTQYVPRSEAEVFVRVPVLSSPQSVAFFNVEINDSGTGAQVVKRTLIGSVELVF